MGAQRRRTALRTQAPGGKKTAPSLLLCNPNWNKLSSNQAALPEGHAIRRLQLSDSLEELTSLLRRAFASLGRQGLNCTCVDQTAAVTRERVQLGDCFVAVADRRV